MKCKYIKYFAIVFLTLLCGVFGGCSDWTDVESVDVEIVRPDQQNPVLWAKYMAALKAYKSSGHLIAYTSFDNGVKGAVGESGFLRSLPDSLDIVSLNNGDNITAYDLEDIKVLQQKSTKVIYLIDYAARAQELSDLAKLDSYIEDVMSRVEEMNLDGFSFTGTPILGDVDQEAAALLLIEKLSTVAGSGKDKLLVFEGDPLFIPSSQMDKINYCVLNTQETENVTDLKMQLMDAIDNVMVPRSKLLIAAKIGNEILDADKVPSSAIDAMSHYVLEMGPLAGLGIYNISIDYFTELGTYYQSRTAIQLMNPSPTK